MPEELKLPKDYNIAEPLRAALTVPEAADILRVHPNTVYAAIKRGDIGAVKIGRRVVVPRISLTLFMHGARPAKIIVAPEAVADEH